MRNRGYKLASPDGFRVTPWNGMWQIMGWSTAHGTPDPKMRKTVCAEKLVERTIRDVGRSLGMSLATVDTAVESWVKRKLV